MDEAMEQFTVTFPDGTEFKVEGILDGNKVFDADGVMMFEVDNSEDKGNNNEEGTQETTG